MAVRYRNKKTNKVVTYAQKMARLEKSKNFERVIEPTKVEEAKDKPKPGA